MAGARATGQDRSALATADDVRLILGTLDEAKLLNIVALRPTILDVEEASVWLAGDSDIFGAGQPLKPVAGEIVAILTMDEEEEPDRGWQADTAKICAFRQLAEAFVKLAQSRPASASYVKKPDLPDI